MGARAELLFCLLLVVSAFRGVGHSGRRSIYGLSRRMAGTQFSDGSGGRGCGVCWGCELECGDDRFGGGGGGGPSSEVDCFERGVLGGWGGGVARSKGSELYEGVELFGNDDDMFLSFFGIWWD